MNYNDWPEYVRKRYALSHTRIGGDSSPSAPSESAEIIVKWLYDILTTLDAKASALMRLNGVLIAAAAFMLGLFGRGSTLLATSPRDAILIVSSATLSAISIFACLWVVNISWSFLGKTTIAPSSAILCDCRNEVVDLANACSARAWAYRGAWAISLIASTLFVLEFTFQAAHVLANGGRLVGVTQ